MSTRSYHASSEHPNEDKEDEDSVAGDVEKLSVLDMIDALDEADLKSQALAVSHAENVSDWVKALAAKQEDSPQRLVDTSAAVADAVDRSVDRRAARWLSAGAARQLLPDSGSLGEQWEVRRGAWSIS